MTQTFKQFCQMCQLEEAKKARHPRSKKPPHVTQELWDAMDPVKILWGNRKKVKPPKKYKTYLEPSRTWLTPN